MTTLLNFVPPVIAHRGASAYAPENTLAAFTKAAQLGVKWVEFDVMTDSGGLPIIFHDEILDRVTNGLGLVKDYPYSYLQTLDAGKWFHPTFSGERILTLDQLMTFLSDAKLNANIELKPSRYEEEKLVLNVLKVMSPYLRGHERINLLFSSFSIDALVFLRNHFPKAKIGLLLHEWVDDWQSTVQTLDCVSLNINEEIMNADIAKKIKKMNKKLLCYTVNNKARAQELFSWGVDAVFSDSPDKIISNVV